jgi:hypothetical protein
VNYEAWEKERKEMWNKYVSHYSQAADGIHSANIFVFEHCILERRLCDKGLGLEGLTDDQKEQIRDIDSHAASIIDNLYMEASVTLDARKGEVVCKRCGLAKPGFKVFVNLPEVGLLMHDQFCHTCA